MPGNRSDYGTEQTDRAVKRVERRLSSVYREAQRDIDDKLKDWQERHKKRDARYRQMVAAGKMSKEDYRAWLRGQVFQEKQWQARRDEIDNILLNADRAAQNIVNDGKLGVFAANANYMGYALERDSNIDTGFVLYSESTVARLIEDDPQILPKPAPGVQKDLAFPYYNKLMSSAITQGIVQGETISEIAGRVARTTGESSYKSAMRNARTAYTGAQNAGRIEGLHQAQRLGIKVKKKWLAILDSRTRDAHANLDGQIQEVDDPFKSDLGDIMFPGDPTAKPGNVYNCRCTLTYEYPDYPSTMPRRDAENGQIVADMTYREWEALKNKQPTMPDRISARTAIIDRLARSDNLFIGDCTPEMREAVINSVGNNPTMLEIVDEMIDDARIRWIDDDGTSHYDYFGNEIVLYTRSVGETRDLDDLSGIFWHEFGHYVDAKDVVRYKYKPGRVDLSGIYYLTDANGYEQAVADDINHFLRRMGLDDQFVCSYSGKAYSTAWVSTIDGALPTPEQNIRLQDALGKWVKGFSRSREAEDYLYTMGYPRRPEYDDYFETYVTPKRKTVKTREKYKGAQEDYTEAMRKAYDAEDAFRASHDMNALIAEQDRLRARVREREEALSYATDTFDGGARGAFFASIWGGHSPDYYRMNGFGEKEGIANVFSVMLTENPDKIEAMKDLCPNIYKCISNVILGGIKK